MMVKTLLSAALLFAALAAPAGLARSGTAADTSLVSVKPASGRDAAMKLAAQDAASVADEACRQQEQGGIDGVLRRLQPAGGYGHGHCLQPPSVAEAEATWR